MRPFNLIQEHKAGTNPPLQGGVRGPPPDHRGTQNPHPGELGGNRDGGSTSGLGGLPRRLERLSSAKHRALLILRHVEGVAEASLASASVVFAPNGTEINPARVASKLCVCADYLRFRHYHTVDQIRLVEAFFCQQHLLCPVCALRRGSRMMETYIPKFESVTLEMPELYPVLITITVRNGYDLLERMQHLRSSMNVLVERRRDVIKKGRGRTEFAKVAGALGSFEVTRKEMGWHPHVHMVALLYDWIDQQAFSREWNGITGDSFVVGVQRLDPLKPPGNAFAEVCKYALKFSDLTPELTWECFIKLRGMRLAFSLGCFRGVEVPEDLRDDLLEGLPYIDFLYRYVAGKGYEDDCAARGYSRSR